jgi:hypothetical protein
MLALREKLEHDVHVRGSGHELTIRLEAGSYGRGTAQHGGFWMSDRNWAKYDFKVGNKIVHSGITKDLERREVEHQQRWPSGHIVQVGRSTTEDAAREWETTKHKTITPPRK